MQTDQLAPTTEMKITKTVVFVSPLRFMRASFVCLLALALMPWAHAQVVTAGLTGLVRDTGGKIVAGSAVTAVHVPTGTTYTATTTAAGRYNLRGLIPGGPYTLTAKADGYKLSEHTDVAAELGADTEVPITMQSATDVIEMTKYVVKAETNQLDSSAVGASSVLTLERIEAKSSTQRSFADLFSVSPAITLRALSGDREEAQITALGQNNRYNSIMIDGSRINDVFGLNGTGLASFFNPLSFDALEQISIKLAPYDAAYSGFTGAALNAVTKSGTNQFHGSAYYIFSGDHVAGLQGQGPDARTLVTSGVKFVPKLERTTKGITFGGPLWKDHVFFFLNWEKFDRLGAPASAGLPGVSSGDVALINSRVAQISKIKYGSLGGNASSKADEEKKLLKLDWNITSQQRLSLRYSSTEGEVPQFGSFTTTSFGSGLNNNSALTNLVGGAATAYDSHFYAQQRKEKSYSARLQSQWTPDFKTTLAYSAVKQDQYTPTAVTGPEIDIFNVSGVNQAGAAVNNGVVVLGTERFRHGNQINVDSKSYSADADYTRGNFTYSGGVNVETNDLFNLFRQFSYGVFNYASPTDFLNDAPRFFQRNFTDLALKGTYGDVSQWTQSGIYGQVKWDVSNRLNVQAGLRYDWSQSNTRPAFNKQFLTDTGMRNDGTVDGATDVSPRAGFNYSVNEERTLQVRGGAGYFVGRAPWVFWSNSYGQTGAGTYTVSTVPTGGLTGYLANSFDPANPLGTGTQTGLARAEIDLADDKTHMPSLWRMNLAADQKLPFLASTLSIEAIHSINENTIFISNDNLAAKGVAADGRTYFLGNPSTAAFAKYPNYTAIYHTRNVRAGQSTYVTLSWDRPLKDKWGFTVAYTRGRATEAQASGQTTAAGAWQRNAVFNQGAVEVGTSDFQIKNRVQVNLSRKFEFVKKAPTLVALSYEGRTGTPYSYAYSGDLNQDGMSGNDLIAVPTGASDSRFDFSALTPAQVQSMLDFMKANSLSQYAGSYAPKNAFDQPWVNRLDLKLSQDIPIHWKAKLKLFLDFTNFGTFVSKKLFNYTERAPSTSNDVFDRRLVGNATIDNTTGKIKVASFTPTDFLIDNTMSRWRIQVGAKLEF
jgi:outer membrane receptor protein involved in Fe transport